MARQRAPLIIGGRAVEIDAPGLEWRDRKNGAREFYWVANPRARAKGYTPRTVRLHFDVSNPNELTRLIATARICQKEMNDWMENPAAQNILIYDGTYQSLIDLYRKDPESPYHSLRQNTRVWFDYLIRIIERTGIARRRLDRTQGKDLRAWHREIRMPPNYEGAPRDRIANGVVRQMLRVLLNYGIELRIRACSELSQLLDVIVFRYPKKSGEQIVMRPKKAAMTYQQAESIVAKALEWYAAGMGKRWRSIALGQAFQFEITMRQIDAIGEWEKIESRQVVAPGECVSRGKIWRPGLTYESISAGILDLTTSKNVTNAIYEIKEYPLIKQVLDMVPEDERIGPVIVDDNGLPMGKRNYSRLYRKAARACDVPDEVWNARSRHGGLSEGYNALVQRSDGLPSQADLADLSYHGQHKKIDTTLGSYVVTGSGPSKRIARLRVASRRNKS